MATLTGAWGKVKTWFSRMKAGVFVDSFEQDLEALGTEIEDAAKGHIENQDIGWAPNLPVTVAKKGHGMVYIETGDYLASIKPKLKRQGRFKFNLTVKVSGSHNSGLSMEELGGWLEHGTSRMVARPLWKVVEKEVPMMGSYQQLLDVQGKISFDI